jgi:hypothetical protein
LIGWVKRGDPAPAAASNPDAELAWAWELIARYDEEAFEHLGLDRLLHSNVSRYFE